MNVDGCMIDEQRQLAAMSELRPPSAEAPLMMIKRINKK